jgi:hypothetical protein
VNSHKLCAGMLSDETALPGSALAGPGFISGLSGVLFFGPLLALVV